IAISETVHQAIGERVELLVGSELWNAGPSSAAGRAKGCDRNIRGAAKGGTGGSHKIDVEFPKIQGVGIERQEEIGRSSGRGGGSVKVGWQQTAKAITKLEADLRSGGAGQHRGAVEGARA